MTLSVASAGGKVEPPEGSGPWAHNLSQEYTPGRRACPWTPRTQVLQALGLATVPRGPWGGQGEVGSLGFSSSLLFRFQTNQSREKR